MHSHLRCECSRQTQAQHDQPTAHRRLAPKRPSASCFDEADILRRVRRLIVFGLAALVSTRIWSCRLRFLRTSGFVDRRKLHRWQRGLHRLLGIGQRLHFSSRKCGQGSQNIHAIGSHALHATVAHHICLQRLGRRCLLCTGRGDTIRLRSGWRRLCITLQRQRSVCKVFSVRQLIPSGLRHRCCRRLRHGFRRNRRGIRRTKRFLQHQLQHVRRQHAAFLPPCKLGRRWWRGRSNRSLGRHARGVCLLPGKGSSRLNNGRRLRTDQWRLRSQKGRRYRIGHRQDFGGASKRCLSQNTGTRRGWRIP